MRITYSQKSNLNAFLFFVFSLILILYTYLSNNSNGFLTLSIAITIEIILFLFFLKKASGHLLSFATIFVIILAVFHFGQVFICGYWSDLIPELKLRIVLNYFSNTECIGAMRIINMSFVGICTGLILSARGNKLSNNLRKNNLLVETNKNKKRALYLIAFTFPVKIIIDMVFFYFSFTSGFLNAVNWLDKFPDVIRTFGNLSMLGFGVLIVSLADDKLKQFKVFAFIMLYLLVQIISGRRSETISYITILAFLFFKTRSGKKLKLSSVILAVISGYILLTLMYTTVRMRDMDNRTIEGFFQLFWLLFTKQNIFMEAIREYGNTGYTAVCVLNNWLKHFPPSYGKSYIFGLSAVLPNIGGIVSKLIVSSTYAIQLQINRMVLDGFRNIGGSVIGELFFNFGKVGGLIASPILGILIGKINSKVNSYIESKQINKLAYYIPAMYAVLYWVRDCFGDGVREVIWGILIWYLIGVIKTKGEIKSE